MRLPGCALVAWMTLSAVAETAQDPKVEWQAKLDALRRKTAASHAQLAAFCRSIRDGAAVAPSGLDGLKIAVAKGTAHEAYVRAMFTLADLVRDRSDGAFDPRRFRPDVVQAPASLLDQRLIVDGTLAAIAGLDLVIMTDSSVAHLTGSLGKPIWNLLPFFAYWLYLRDRSDSPWYPSMRLFRQPRPGDWDRVFKDAADALAELAKRRR